MDAVEFLKECKRMCGEYDDCSGCQLKDMGFCFCSTREKGSSEEAVAVVEKWSKEHPRKTILMDFMEKHPKASLKTNGTPVICAGYLGYSVSCIKQSGFGRCYECWNAELEEVGEDGRVDK